MSSPYGEHSRRSGRASQQHPGGGATMLGAPVDLTSLDCSTSLPWVQGAEGVVRPGVRTLWFAKRGQGKSLAALLLSVQIAAAGGQVVYIDLENGARRQAARLGHVLDDRTDPVRRAVSERVRYHPSARLATVGASAGAAWADELADADLVIFDSLARALGTLGLEENQASDFTRFVLTYVDPLAEGGAAVLLLDNTGHTQSSRARGTSAKLDLVEVAYELSSTRIRTDKHGEIALKLVRGRDGDEPAALSAGAGGGRYTAVCPAAGSTATSSADNDLGAQIIAVVTRSPGLSSTAVGGALKRRRQDVRQQLERLEREQVLERRAARGPDKAGRRSTHTGWFPIAGSVPSASDVGEGPDG